MALGALLDAGAPLDAVRGQLDLLGLDGWSLDVEPATRGGLAGTYARVRAQVGPAHRRYSWIRDHLSAAPLAAGVRSWALQIFAVLAEAEAHVHRIEVDRVHFHEVGALDAIIDVVGVAAALDALGVARGSCSSVVTGFGVTSAAHGTLPVPAPAVVEILRRSGIPSTPGDLAFETIEVHSGLDAQDHLLAPKRLTALLGAAGWHTTQVLDLPDRFLAVASASAAPRAGRPTR